jgi:hypothetical protein
VKLRNLCYIQAVQRLIKSGTLQAKLKIGQPGDKYEQEAERVAEQVMRMPEPGVQRQVEPEEEEEEELQAKATSGRISEANPNLESNIQSLKGGGSLYQKTTAPFSNRASAVILARCGCMLMRMQRNRRRQ